MPARVSNENNREKTNLIALIKIFFMLFSVAENIFIGGGGVNYFLKFINVLIINNRAVLVEDKSLIDINSG
jgi:hypothetical protein